MASSARDGSASLTSRRVIATQSANWRTPATRRYQALRNFDDALQLPSGYAGMIPLAYIPTLWFRVMDPKVVAHHGGDLGEAHLHPRRREALLARWSQDTARVQ